MIKYDIGERRLRAERPWGRKSVWGLLAVLGIAACSSSTGPDLSSAQGIYTLESVNGVALPVPFESGSCPREIHTGMLYLGSGAPDQLPLYTIIVELRSQCDPAGSLPTDRRIAVHDGGTWSLLGGLARFSSDLGYGNYSVPIEPQTPAEQGPLLTLQFDGRNYTFRRTQITN